MENNDHQRNVTEVPPIIRIQQLSKYYIMGRTIVPALCDINLDVVRGEFVSIMGPSGSGKTTLMNILGCLDKPTSGHYFLDGIAVSQMSTRQLADIRNQKIGFVFQSFNLLSWMSALENVQLPLVYAGVPAALRQQRALEALTMVGLYARANHRPMELSGGQQQRVAIARVLVTSPALILADEPTGNVDSRASAEIMSVLQKLNERGRTIVLVTHDTNTASYSQRKITFRDGRIIDDTAKAETANAEQEQARENDAIDACSQECEKKVTL